MTAESVKQFEALERQAASLMGVFTRAGCEAVAPAVIQPADIFLDVIGEDLRSRTYVFTDPEGHELCLRPDLTVPTCRIYLARHPAADVTARFCYNGPTFRFQPYGVTAAHPNEFRQAGIELIADQDREQAETQVLALIIEAVRTAGLTDFRLRMGDLGLFHALLDEVEMPERGRQRLRAQFWRPEAFRTALQRLSATAREEKQPLPQALAARLEGADVLEAEKVVTQYLDDNAVPLVGTRSTTEIAEGLLAAVADARAEPIPASTARLIEQYLAVKGRAPDMVGRIEALIAAAGPRAAAAAKAFGRRLELMSQAGIDAGAIEFSAEFGRNLEYYTGLVFDIVSPKLGPQSPIAGGGRYDHLMRAVGASRDVPAVGSAIHTERLLAVVDPGSRSGAGANAGAAP